MHRVAITGMGCISALGHTAPQFWRALRDGVSGIAEIAAVPPEKLHIRVAAEVKDYHAESHFDAKRLVLLDRFSQFSVIAAREAIADAGLDFSGELGANTSVIVGTGVGGMNTVDNAYRWLYGEGKARANPLTVPRLMTSAAASHITMDQGITGAAFAVSSACSSASHAIGEAYWMVRSGRVAAAIAGGSEACVTEGVMRAWEALRVLAPDTCRPFSRGRKGLVLGEGAGIVVLEPLDAARRRGARIHAELAGYGATSDAGDIVNPSETGAAAALSMALEVAGLSPDQIDYVNAHGTGTMVNDATETRVLHRVFGAHARNLAVSSSKSMHGHALGAAGALELVATVYAINQGLVPPTANFIEPDPACDLDYTPGTARERPIGAAVSNSFAFGGLNAVLAVRRHN